MQPPKIIIIIIIIKKKKISLSLALVAHESKQKVQLTGPYDLTENLQNCPTFMRASNCDFTENHINAARLVNTLNVIC